MKTNLLILLAWVAIIGLPSISQASPTDLDQYLNSSLNDQKTTETNYDQVLTDKSQYRPDSLKTTTSQTIELNANGDLSSAADQAPQGGQAH